MALGSSEKLWPLLWHVWIYSQGRKEWVLLISDSGLPSAGMLLALILGRPSWYPWGTSRTWFTVRFGPPCRPIVRWLFVQGGAPRSSVLHVCFPLPSDILSTSTLSLRNILSFWNWSLFFQVSSLPLFSVVLRNEIGECKFLLHVFYLLSYGMFCPWKGKCSLYNCSSWAEELAPKALHGCGACGSRNQCVQVNPGLSTHWFFKTKTGDTIAL